MRAAVQQDEDIGLATVGAGGSGYRPEETALVWRCGGARTCILRWAG